MVDVIGMTMSVPFVFAAVALPFVWIERTIGITSFWRAGALELAGLILLVGGPAFAGVTVALVRCRPGAVPSAHTHGRHCGVIYLGAALLLASLVRSYANENGALLYGIAASVLVVLVFAIVVNAGTLAVLNWTGRQAPGEHTAC